MTEDRRAQHRASDPGDAAAPVASAARSLAEIEADIRPPELGEFDLFWLDAMEQVLEPLLENPERCEDVARTVDQGFGGEAVRLAVQHLIAAGPAQFDDTHRPPRSIGEWTVHVAQAAIDLVDRADRLHAEARVLLDRGTEAEAVLRIVAGAVRQVVSDRVVATSDEALRATRVARDLFVQEPDPRGAWVLDAVGGPAEFALHTVARLAARLLMGSPRLASPPLAVELAAGLRPAALLGPPPDRWARPGLLGPLGFDDEGRPVMSRERAGPASVLGPPGTGKTELAKALMLRPSTPSTRGPFLVTTTKPWDYRQVLPAIPGPRLLVNASGDDTGLDGIAQSVGYDPLTGVETAEQAKHLAAMLALTKSDMGITDADYWRGRAADLIFPHLLRAARTERSLATVALEVHNPDIGNLLQWCTEEGEPTAFAAARGYAALPDATRECVRSTADEVMAPFVFGLHGCLDELPRFDPEQALLDNATIVLHSNARTAGLTASYCVTVMDALISAAARLSAGGWNRKLTALLDEVANVCSSPDLPQITSIAPAMGVNLVLFFQSPEQLGRVWGPSGQEILDNSGALVVYPGSTNLGLRSWIHSLRGGSSPAETDLGDTATASVRISLGQPDPPPAPGRICVVDEFGGVTDAAQIRSYEDNDVIAARVDGTLRHHPLLNELARSLGRSPGPQTFDLLQDQDD